MKDLLPVLRVLGMLMIMFAGAMLLPFGISWFTQDGIWRIYPWSIGLTVGVGLLLWGGLHRHKQDLQPRHGVILVTLVWVVLPLCAMVPLMMGLNIITESSLSFLSIGVQAPDASWGTIIQDGQTLLYTRPAVALAPGIAIVLTVLSLNVLGDSLRDALDPRTKLV